MGEAKQGLDCPNRYPLAVGRADQAHLPRLDVGKGDLDQWLVAQMVEEAAGISAIGVARMARTPVYPQLDQLGVSDGRRRRH